MNLQSALVSSLSSFALMIAQQTLTHPMSGLLRSEGPQYQELHRLTGSPEGRGPV